MKITNVEVFPVAPKTNYVKISTDEGICGWGEPVVEGRRGSVAAAVLELKPLLLGKNPENIEDLFYLMYRGNFYKGGPVLMSAISGAEQALWDIKGKAYQKPVYQLIGGAAKEKQRVYAWVHGDTPEELGEAAKRRLKQGYRYIKTCVTHQMEWIDSNSAITKAGDMMGGIRDAVGDQLEVGVDFHGRVHKSMAAKMMKEMEQYNVLFVEEPVLPGNEEALVELHRVANIPIATGERLFGRWDFKRILQLGAVDIIQPDLSHAGGIWEVRKIAAMAEAFDVAVAPSAHAASGLGAVVGGDASAVVGECSVCINGRIAVSVAGELERTAVDRQAAVGVDAVAVGNDGDRSAIDENEAASIRSKLILFAEAKARSGTVVSAGSVDAIIGSRDVQRTAADRDGLALYALIAGGNGEAPCLNDHGSIGMNGVIARTNDPLAAGDGHVPAGMHGVIRGIQRKRPAVDRQRAARLDALAAFRVRCSARLGGGFAGNGRTPVAARKPPGAYQQGSCFACLLPDAKPCRAWRRRLEAAKTAPHSPDTPCRRSGPRPSR